LKRIVLGFAFLAVAASCFAPINEGPPKVIKPESSQERVAQDQAGQHTMAPVGITPQKDSPYDQTQQDHYDPNAAQALAAAGDNKADIEDPSVAAKNLKTASKTLGSTGGTPFWIWGVLACAGGFGAVYGLKAWADKHIPVPSRMRRYKW
jgi:hypothetical protein